MADQVKDTSSPGFSSTMYESAYPSNEITLVLPPWTAGTNGVLTVVTLAEGFLKLIASSMNVQSPMDAKQKVHTCDEHYYSSLIFQSNSPLRSMIVQSPMEAKQKVFFDQVRLRQTYQVPNVRPDWGSNS